MTANDSAVARFEWLWDNTLVDKRNSLRYKHIMENEICRDKMVCHHFKAHFVL
jgi:hypothetical protein